MARRRRSDIFVPGEIAVVHVMNKVVRGHLLFGYDPITNRNYDHRKAWMESRLELQARCFAIDLLGFSVLDNHFHQMLRSRPDIVATWSDEEVARRWLTLCPERFDEKGIPLEPTDEDISRLCRQAKKIKEIRERLSDISWWMRLFNQTIAQKANREDGMVGRLWQGRFKATRLLDEASILACMAYVDLNPIRTGLSQSLEDSLYTSVRYRMLELKDKLSADPAAGHGSETTDSEVIDAVNNLPEDFPQSHQNKKRASSDAQCYSMVNCLSPVELTVAEQENSTTTGTRAVRCSNKGFLQMSTEQYVNLLDWTARQRKLGKTGATPAEFAPIFDRLGITAEAWFELVGKFGQLFGCIAGTPSKVDDYRALKTGNTFRLRKETRDLFARQAQ